MSWLGLVRKDYIFFFFGLVGSSMLGYEVVLIRDGVI